MPTEILAINVQEKGNVYLNVLVSKCTSIGFPLSFGGHFPGLFQDISNFIMMEIKDYRITDSQPKVIYFKSI